MVTTNYDEDNIMRYCETHEETTARHVMRVGSAMLAVCCKCWLKDGNNPSKFHTCT